MIIILPKSPAFKDAFKDCDVLKDGGIKVPSGWLTTYQAEALTMSTAAAKFKGDGTTPSSFAVTFSVEGSPANGTLTAAVGNNGITSDNTVEQDKAVTFTAEPAANYKIKAWKVGEYSPSGVCHTVML